VEDEEYVDLSDEENYPNGSKRKRLGFKHARQGGILRLDNGSRRRRYDFLRDGKLPRNNSQVIHVTVKDNARMIRRRFLDRQFTVFEPANEDDAKRPLVLAYHGVMSNSETMRQLTQFDREAKDRGWLAVYPQGEWKYLEEMTNWNGAGCCTRGQDDIAFTKQMINYMVRHFNVDETKVFVTGVSNGGFMVYKLLCEMGNRENGKHWIAAASVHSGLLGAWQADFSSCSISKDTPLIHFHGLSDPVVKIRGKPQGERELEGLMPPGVPFAPVTNAEWKSVKASINDVAEAICGSSVITNTTNASNSTTCHELCQGKVEYCLVEKLEHQWSGCRTKTLRSGKTLDMFDPNHVNNVDATKYFADFFSKHSMNQEAESKLVDQ
jgi:poly(3-hydroxybutyrate) depolymerase